jgi:primosomal protein N' (replication factor Y) (superfamily II helicase)
MMPYAEVSVNSPFGQKKAFSYSVPLGLEVEVGQAVWVPFGDNILQGIVLELCEYPSVEETREIAGIINDTPLLSPAHLSLALWLSGYYLVALFEAIALMLPPGFERRIVTSISSLPEALVRPEDLNAEQIAVLEHLRKKGKMSLKQLEKTFSKKSLHKILSQLLNSKLISKDYKLENVKIGPKRAVTLNLKTSRDEVLRTIEDSAKRAVGQTKLLKYLLENNRSIPLGEVRKETGASAQAIKKLVSQGLIELQEVQVQRDPLSARNINLSFPLSLTPDQSEAFRLIKGSLSKENLSDPRRDVFLLRGVTGSGKTEIYLQLLTETVRLGRKGIVLVPEISMTPQILERFISRFPGRVAILHSQLSLGEQFDEWWRIKKGEFDVVIGPRSAVFAPQPDLGLIVIDEEHEWTYKQQDSPRYHARQAAIKLAEFSGATVVLGSATPDVESYYLATEGEYHLLELSERVTSGSGSVMPRVEIVDLREELKAGNLGIFSRSLNEAINSALHNHEQIILFLNRRGSASFVECRNCGFVVGCKRCQSPLSYHHDTDQLVCHHCNYRGKNPEVCPRCRSRKIKYLGIGTEKLEQETAIVFPQAKLLRWDSDVTRAGGYLHQEIFDKFRNGEADILIGTQMIAKGLDLPGVTLVGVINADIALNLPDFRANERTFQLLSQVAGRAGRGSAPGRVVIQTYSPENYAVQAAACHDYLAFYDREIAYRRDLHNPPFSRLTSLLYAHPNQKHCQEEVQRMMRMLLERVAAEGITGFSLVGPAPAFIERLRGRFRWHMVIRSSDPAALLSSIPFPKGWRVEIDPMGLG